MLRLFTQHPDQRVVYIAPLKALVRERLDDWGNKLCSLLNKKMIELTGDYTPDIRFVKFSISDISFWNLDLSVRRISLLRRLKSGTASAEIGNRVLTFAK